VGLHRAAGARASRRRGVRACARPRPTRAARRCPPRCSRVRRPPSARPSAGTVRGARRRRCGSRSVSSRLTSGSGSRIRECRPSGSENAGLRIPDPPAGGCERLVGLVSDPIVRHVADKDRRWFRPKEV
jgi:hypothetical protein